MDIRLILLLLITLTAPVRANIFASWGVEFDHPGTEDKGAVKFVEFGRSGEQGRLAYTVGVGGWIDHTGYKTKAGGLTYTAHSSGFAEALFGVEPKSDHFYITYKLGPAIITDSDALLGSNIQCGHEVGIGMRDVRDVRVGLVLKHFSNAGIVGPNIGRNFLGFRIEF